MYKVSRDFQVLGFLAYALFGGCLVLMGICQIFGYESSLKDYYEWQHMVLYVLLLFVIPFPVSCFLFHFMKTPTGKDIFSGILKLAGGLFFAVFAVCALFSVKTDAEWHLETCFMIDMATLIYCAAQALFCSVCGIHYLISTVSENGEEEKRIRKLIDYEKNGIK